MTVLDPNFVSSKPYGSEDLRSTFSSLQEGVVSPGDLKVTGAAAGLSIDVAAGVGFVQGDAVADQGLYRARNDAALNSSAFTLGGIAAAHATLPRLDQIVLRIYDDDSDALGSYKAQLEVINGVATAGATLDNRTGAGALPNSALRLADVLVPAAFAGPLVTATHVRDRRTWARGLYSLTRQLSGADYAITSTSFAAIDATNIEKRVECSGKVLRVRLNLSAWSMAVAGQTATLQVRLDGVTAEGSQGREMSAPGVNYNMPESLLWEIPAASVVAGSHLVGIYAKVSAGTLTIERGAQYGVGFSIEEVLRETADNG